MKTVAYNHGKSRVLLQTTWLNSLQSAQEKYREQKHTVDHSKSSNTLAVTSDDALSTSSATSSVSGARLMTSYYDVVWQPIHPIPAQQTSSATSPTPPPTIGVCTPSSPAARASSTTILTALTTSETGIVDGRQLSPQSPGSCSRDQMLSSSLSSSPKSPSYAAVNTPEVIVSVLDCSVAADTAGRLYGSRQVNGGQAEQSSWPVQDTRVRSLSSDSLTQSASIAAVRGNS